MHEKPKLQCTRDYDLFEMHPCNRPLHESEALMRSIQEHGFMPSSAIHCVRNGSGKLRVVRGHHRLDCAKRVKSLVWYIVDATPVTIFELEGDTRQIWSGPDFLSARSSDGDKHCAAVLDFKAKHGLTLGAAASLLGGQSAGSNNKVRDIKSGRFRVASDLSHAHTVVSITDRCREHGISFATQAAFVTAVSCVARVQEFDAALFLHRVALNGSQMRKRSSVDNYLDEIDALYNYGAKQKRIPLAFRAREVGKERKARFGKGDVKKKKKP